MPHALHNDRDWDFLQPILTKTLKADIQPGAHTYESYHFYRHSFAAWNLTGEALRDVFDPKGLVSVTEETRRNP